MTAFEALTRIAADPAPRCTARQIIEARLGRPLGTLSTMPADLRRALYLLALQIQKVKHDRA